MARAAKPRDPAAARASLQRNLASAEAALERLHSQLAGESDHTRRDKLSAALKQAEIKLLDVQDKLASLEQGGEGLAAASSDAQHLVAKLNPAAPAEPVAEGEPTSDAERDQLARRLDIARAKLEASDGQDANAHAALVKGVANLEARLSEAAPTAHRDAPPAAPAQGDPMADSTPAQLDRAAAAIARAQANKVDRAALTTEEKQAQKVAQLEARVTKARTRLAAAEAGGDDTAEALATALASLENKLADARKALADSGL